MKSVYQRLAEKFDELEERGQEATVIEIRESGQSWERKLAEAERAIGAVGKSSEEKVAEAARRAFKLTPEQARVFAQDKPVPVDRFWEQIKEMD